MYYFLNVLDPFLKISYNFVIKSPEFKGEVREDLSYISYPTWRMVSQMHMSLVLVPDKDVNIG